VTDPIADEVVRLSYAASAWMSGRNFDFLLEEPPGDDMRLQPSPWGGSWSLVIAESRFEVCEVRERQ
jgi:hypothetical protein